MMEAKVTIQKIQEQPGVDAQGKPAAKVAVVFMVDQHGPFTEVFDKASFDPVKAKAQMLEFAQKLKNLHA
jgi:hypothetical protein